MTKTKIDQDILSRTHIWSNLVAYQTNAIISRTLIDKKGGTTTLFAFDAGQSLSEHTAPYDALVLILDGNMEINIEGTLHNVETGGCIIMPANKPHALQAKDKTAMLLVMIRS